MVLRRLARSGRWALVKKCQSVLCMVVAAKTVWSTVGRRVRAGKLSVASFFYFKQIDFKSYCMLKHSLHGGNIRQALKHSQ